VWHAKNCDLISPRLAEELYAERETTERRWMSTFEGGRSDDVTPSLDIKSDIADQVSPLWAGFGAAVVSRAYEAGLISAARAKEIFGWS
jgi:hypothetical protein